jgi:hypothetical protein
VATDISRTTRNQNAHAAFTSNVNLHINTQEIGSDPENR